MTRVPGEPIDKFLSTRAARYGSLETVDAPKRGCALAGQLLAQLGPTLVHLSPHVWHRDVNTHNVLLADSVDGGRFSMRSNETACRASFWLIDFGLAVDSTTWGARWEQSEVSGDCRYWPPASWMMILKGPEHVR